MFLSLDNKYNSTLLLSTAMSLSTEMQGYTKTLGRPLSFYNMNKALNQFSLLNLKVVEIEEGHC